MVEFVDLHDPSIGLAGVIAIHSTARGPAFGGIRRLAYADSAAAKADALALAEAMSFKCALAGLPAGGGKTALQQQAGADVDAVYEAVGRAVERLGGRYVCGPDLGTGPAQLARVRAQTRWANPETNDAGASTAAGVLAGLRAVWRALGIESEGSSAAIAGLGAVGLAVARSLLSLGVRVQGADLDPRRCEQAAALGVDVVAADAILSARVDVFMPCATGGVLTAASVPRLRCNAVCGSANNQLGDAEAALALVRRGIVHAPDIIVSAGAVTEGVLTVAHGTAPECRARVARAIAGLEAVTAEVLAAAAAAGDPPDAVARARAADLLRC